MLIMGWAKHPGSRKQGLRHSGISARPSSVVSLLHVKFTSHWWTKAKVETFWDQCQTVCIVGRCPCCTFTSHCLTNAKVETFCDQCQTVCIIGRYPCCTFTSHCLTKAKVETFWDQCQTVCIVGRCPCCTSSSHHIVCQTSFWRHVFTSPAFRLSGVAPPL